MNTFLNPIQDSGAMFRQINGGVNIGADNVEIGGDVVGRDKLIAGGDIVQVQKGAQIIYTNVERALTEVEIARQAKDFEREQLADAVKAYVQLLQQRAQQARRSRRGNPFKALLEYDIGDVDRFYGRSMAIEALLACVDRSSLTVLHADGGMGKTSLLKAGIEPNLLARGHLPLYVRPQALPVAEAVKRALFPQIAQTPDLHAASLRDFLYRVTGLLGKQWLVLILDPFEDVFILQNAEARARFAAELTDCLADDLLPVRWVLSLSGKWFGHLSTFQSLAGRLFANPFFLAAFTPDEANDVIVRTAQDAGLAFEPELVEKLLDDLGPEAIAPPQLQRVCHTLVEALPLGGKQLTVAAYQRLGRTDGILRGYLDGVFGRNVPSTDQTPAWLILAAIADQRSGSATEAELIARLGIEAVRETDARRVLKLLEANRLVKLGGERYQLTSESLLPRIQQWTTERAVRKLARAEAARQLERIRNSALRGMLGGALGFSLSFLIAYWTQINTPSLRPYLIVIHALPGAFAGLLLILLEDVALASYRGSRRWLRWPAGGLAGALAFGLAVLFHATLQLRPSELNPQTLLLISVEGALWGSVVGIGATWVMNRARPKIHTLFAVSAVAMLSGVALRLADTFGRAFGDPQPAILLLAAGAVMPLCVLATASLARTRVTEVAS